MEPSCCQCLILSSLGPRSHPRWDAAQSWPLSVPGSDALCWLCLTTVALLTSSHEIAIWGSLSDFGPRVRSHSVWGCWPPLQTLAAGVVAALGSSSLRSGCWRWSQSCWGHWRTFPRGGVTDVPAAWSAALHRTGSALLNQPWGPSWDRGMASGTHKGGGGAPTRRELSQGGELVAFRRLPAVDWAQPLLLCTPLGCRVVHGPWAGFRRLHGEAAVRGAKCGVWRGAPILQCFPGSDTPGMTEGHGGPSPAGSGAQEQLGWAKRCWQQVQKSARGTFISTRHGPGKATRRVCQISVCVTVCAGDRPSCDGISPPRRRSSLAGLLPLQEPQGAGCPQAPGDESSES